MGCLFDVLLFPFDCLFELIIDGWFSLMQWIIPQKQLGRGTRLLLQIIIGVFSAVLLITFCIGVLGAIFTEATALDLWKLIFIPLGISIVQILIGILVRLTSRKK